MPRDDVGFPWRVGISSESGPIVGGGLLIDRTTVLTCAHVVSSAGGTAPDDRPERAVSVWFVGMPGIARRDAVVPDRDAWHPRTEDHGGDLALLRLDPPVTEVAVDPAPLRRNRPASDVLVRACGFPRDDNVSLWARALTAGSGGPPHGEWRQLYFADRQGPLITRGYSGAAVVDVDTGDVLGIVNADYRRRTGDTPVAAFMIPIETVVRYLPGIGRRISGSPALDVRVRERVERVATGTPVAGRYKTALITRWLAEAVAGEVLVLHRDLAPLDVVVAMADRERSSAVDRMRRDSRGAPRVGSVDLVVDATERTVGEIAARVTEILGIGVDVTGARAPQRSDQDRRRSTATLVITRVDGAADPSATVGLVVEPLVAHARTLDLRLVIGVDDPVAPAAVAVRQCASLAQRVRGMRIAVDELDGAEDDLVSDELWFTQTAGATLKIDRRRRALESLERGWATDPDCIRHKLDRKLAEDLDGFEVRRSVAAGRVAELHRLRRELPLDRAWAGGLLDEPAGEDHELDELLHTAREAVSSPPVDLERARTALRAYRAEIERRERGSR